MNSKEFLPKLRFLDFSGYWSKVKLGNSCNILMCKRIFADQTQEVGDIPFYKIGTLGNQADAYISKELFLEYRSKYKFPKKGEILITCSGTVGKSVIFDGHNSYYQDSNIVWLDNPNEIIRNDFLFLLLQKINWNKLNSTTIARIYSDDLRSLKLIIPNKEEQQKISSFLSLVEEKITKLKEKKELLEQYKKGVMQQIFSQELRFKDDTGEDFPEWEELQLSEVLYEHKTKNKDDEFDEVFSVAKHKGVINQIEHLGRSYSAKEISHYKVILPGDIVYTKSPTSEFPFGIIKQNRTGRTGVVSPLYGVFTPDTESLGFILHEYFSSPVNTYNYLNPLVQKGAKNTMNINNDAFLNGAQISLPVSEKEQKKIADFILILNKKIELTENQVNELEVWKKGLLQQMFV